MDLDKAHEALGADTERVTQEMRVRQLTKLWEAPCTAHPCDRCSVTMLRGEPFSAMQSCRPWTLMGRARCPRRCPPELIDVFACLCCPQHPPSVSSSRAPNSATCPSQGYPPPCSSQVFDAFARIVNPNGWTLAKCCEAMGYDYAKVQGGVQPEIFVAYCMKLLGRSCSDEALQPSILADLLRAAGTVLCRASYLVCGCGGQDFRDGVKHLDSAVTMLCRAYRGVSLSKASLAHQHRGMHGEGLGVEGGQHETHHACNRPVAISACVRGLSESLQVFKALDSVGSGVIPAESYVAFEGKLRDSGIKVAGVDPSDVPEGVDCEWFVQYWLPHFSDMTAKEASKTMKRMTTTVLAEKMRRTMEEEA